MKRILKLIAAIAAAGVICSCSSSGTDSAEKYSQWIKACTGQFVTSDATIQVEFTSPVGGCDVSDVFSFTPSVEGKARWAAPTLLEYIPADGALKGGKHYTATLKLGKIVSGSPDKFSFDFNVAPKSAAVLIDRYVIPADSPYGADICGRICFSEPVDGEKVVPGLLKWSDEGGFATVTATNDPSEYEFSIVGLPRGSEDKEVTVVLNAASLGFKEKSEASVTLPAAGNFKLADAFLNSEADPFIELLFSEPLDEGQSLNGLISLGGGAGKSYMQRNGSVVRVYFERRNDNDVTLDVSRNIRNFEGGRLSEDVSGSFQSNALKPAVEIPVSGSILPDEGNLVIPFKAVCLSAVDVSVIRIYEDNILTFLQENDLDGSYQLRRSGRLVYKNTVRLDKDPDIDLHQWNDFSLDLNDIARQEPGAIYRVRISFRKDYSLWGQGGRIPGAASNSLVSLSSGNMTEQDEAVWDEPSSYYYESDDYDWSEYNWKDRDNPATPTYYMQSGRYPGINVISSDIGMIAKAADGRKLWVAVSDIRTAAPLSGVEIKAYNFQLREIGRARSNNGLAEIEPDGKAFVLVAKKGKSVSYLKVTDGEEKSLSRFDTGGTTVSNGLKGYVYGERGVWRPGDTLHVTLVVQDKSRTLPDNHPVTMELFTPQGQFYSKMVDINGKDGFHLFDIPTVTTDPTGIWNAYFKVGGATFHKSLRIETVKANRLKLALSHDGDVLSSGTPTEFSLQANWLTGPAASGLKATVEMSLTKHSSGFKGYDGYEFNNPAVNFSDSEWLVLNKTTDGNGTASASVVLPQAKNAPGLLNANLVCRVMEGGGDSSISTETALFSPFSSYVGVKLGDYYRETDTDLNFPVVIVDKDGHKVTGHKIEYKIWKMDWSWWWENTADNLGSYVNSSSARTIADGTFTCPNGEASIPFRVEYPEWGRYLVFVKDLSSGHAAGGVVFIDWPSWRGRSDKSDPNSLTMLSFSTDKKEYEVGEEMTVYIPASDGGRALVSIENGSTVLSRTWVNGSADGDAVCKLKVTPEMAPNFYVHITMVQPHEKTGEGQPIRLYGVEAVSVSNPKSHLNPVIDVPQVIRPLESFTVKVSEKNRKPMTYTLAIVDEGLLDLTNFKTPDPWKVMYAREALGIRTWDLYDEIIGAYAGKFANIIGVGGDEDNMTGNKKENRFNPVVKFLGPFTLKGGADTHKITLPMYVGSVRVMVVAGKDGAYGNAEKTVPVRSPLMILPTLPRILGCGEEVTLPVNVFAMEGNMSNVSVKVKVEGPVRIVGNSSRSLSFSAPGDKLAGFSLATDNAEGNAKVTVTATGGGYTATETISIDVRNANAATVKTVRKAVKAGETASFEWQPFESDADNWAKVELTSLPSIDFNGTFEYMNDYSYSCTEQLSAKALNYLYTGKFLEEKNAEKAKEAIPAILKELYSRQLPDGGFAYWPGSLHANEWASSMAGEALIEARAQGYQVSRTVLNSWINFQKKCVRNYRHSERYNLNDLQQAYRLHTLALAGEADAGAMNRLKEAAKISSQARWRLAAAYCIAGKKAVAQEMIKGISTTVEYCPDGRVGTFWSSIRDKAMILETLVLAGEDARALDLAQTVAQEYSEGYHCTQDIAFISLAMGQLAKKYNSSATEVELAQSAVRSVRTTDAVRTENVNPAEGSLGVTNKSAGTVYATLITRSKPAAGEAIAAKSNGVRLNVKYVDRDGKAVSPASLRQGTDFTVKIEVANVLGTESITNLALKFSAAAGWEIFNERMFDAAASGEACSYKDIRDDSVIWYFDLPAGTKKSFSVKCQAAYAGKYILPAVSCEAMYDAKVSANTANGTAQVVL